MTIFIVSLLACVTAYHFEKKMYTPASLTTYVQRDFSLREKVIQKDYTEGLFKQFLRENRNGSLPADYFLFIVREGVSVSWNTITVDLPASIKRNPDSFRQGQICKLANGSYYIRSWYISGPPQDKSKTYAYSVIPIAYDYPIDNQYFQSRFAADKRVPVSTQINIIGQKGAYAITDLKGKPAFYLEYTQPVDEIYLAPNWVWLLGLIALFSLVFWIHEFCYGIGLKTSKPANGWFVLLLFVCGLAVLKESVPYPVGFHNSMLFSPELYSSGESVKSLGDLILDSLMNSWVLLYLIAYVPLSDRRILAHKLMDILIRLVFVLALLILLYRDFAVSMSSLVIDSKISFEAGDFSSINVYTFIGIFSLAVITINFLLLLGIVNALIAKIIKWHFIKYLIVILFSVLVMWLLPDRNIIIFYVVILFMSLAGMLLIDVYGLPLQKSRKQYNLSIAPSTYIWFAIICSWITLEIFYFNYSKEKELRKVFAGKQEQKDDGLMAYGFMEVAEGLQKDSLVQSFLMLPDAEQSNKMGKYISYNFLSDYTRKYSIDVYYYDKKRLPLFVVDSTDKPLLKLADSIAGGRFLSGMVNVEKATGNNHMYWFLCPVTQKVDGDTLGYIGFDVAVDKRPKMMNQRSFLEKKNNPTDQQYFNNYSFAIYRNNTLWTQGGDHIFPYINKGTKLKKEFTFTNETLHSSTLLLRTSGNGLVEVIYTRNLLTNIISLFSYVLGVLLVLAGIIFLVRQLMFYPGKLRAFLRNFNFTIRSKVNITILVTVFASLLVVGIITLSFLNNRYKETQRKNLQSLLLYYTQNILHFSKEQHYDFSALGPGFFSAYSDLSYKLNTLAEEQGADINLYDQNGKLIATSQLELFKKGLISKNMQREVFLTLRRGDQSEFIVQDKIGDLEYQSIYTSLRDENDKILAYVNLPYYASRAELNNEISNVLVALINVYTLVFFLSGICAILISNSIIRSFRLLIDQFRNIRLRHNEYIEWPYKDEIGVLVKEYNTMMRKVEAMATRLAHTEREAAWREIARQVAHEIKNPLTPMKLNIQYLQQAIDSGRPDIEKLASRVSVTLIEQIENLNLIATEFSNFAKMPEADPEELNLHQSLQSLVTLFQKDSKVNVTLVQGDEHLLIYMDKSYFIRIFTNLIQNAIQSIEEDKTGQVVITYEQKENNLVIKISDNGSGIPQELQEKLFLPYFTTKSSGTGLGLPMTKNMVEHSNGTIWFRTWEKEGSEFYVQLPLMENNK